MSEMSRERDLVLNPNEYAYVLDKTKGLISCVVGSYKMSLSTSDSLVVFNEKTKRFEESNFNDAITTFVSAPENWYITLKNPAEDDKHPTPGTSNQLPELQIGKKVNIRGNVSFALYPGQMAKAIQGHRLHSNQYLLARVYDADVLEKINEVDEDGIATGVVKKLAEVDRTKADLDYATKIYKINLDNKISKEQIQKEEEIKRIKEQSKISEKSAEQKLQSLMDSIQKSELARKKERFDVKLNRKKEFDNLEILKQKAYTDAIKKVVESISPDLIASMTSSSNAELLKSVSEAMSPYAMATGESIADVTNKLLRGTSLEGLIEKITTITE